MESILNLIDKEYLVKDYMYNKDPKYMIEGIILLPTDPLDELKE